MQLKHERTEERRKLFKIAEKRQNAANLPLSRWKKILPALPRVKAEVSRNSEVTSNDSAQIVIDKPKDSVERKQITEGDLSHDQILSDCNNEKQTEGRADLTLNDATFGKRYVLSEASFIRIQF